MSKFDLTSLTAAELKQLSKEANTQAKIKKKEEQKKIQLDLGKFVYKNIDSLLNSNIDIELRKEIAKIANKEFTQVKNESAENKATSAENKTEQ